MKPGRKLAKMNRWDGESLASTHKHANRDLIDHHVSRCGDQELISMGTPQGMHSMLPLQTVRSAKIISSFSSL
jgi:hypothetical protein